MPTNVLWQADIAFFDSGELAIHMERDGITNVTFKLLKTE